MNWDAVGALAELFGAAAVVVSLFCSLEQQYLLRKEGALDDESWRAVEHITRDFAELPGTRTYRTYRGQWYAESFMAYVWRLVGGRPKRAGRTLVQHYAGDAGGGREPAPGSAAEDEGP